jgi:lipopolysaccharide transport system permease protein
MKEVVLEAGRAERHCCGSIANSFAFPAWRDVAVRYEQTVIGAAWALIRPFLTMVVFTVIFGKLPKLPSEAAAAPD